jgi:hypothetical protein
MAKHSGRDLALEKEAVEFMKYKGVKVPKNIKVAKKFMTMGGKLGFWHPAADDIFAAPHKTHEVRGREVDVYKPHLSMGKKPCTICNRNHSTSEHMSHGAGSMARTHGGGVHGTVKGKKRKASAAKDYITMSADELMADMLKEEGIKPKKAKKMTKREKKAAREARAEARKMEKLAGKSKADLLNLLKKQMG